jgi:spore maturation protein CgeB
VGDKQPIWSDDFILSLKQTKMALNLSQGKPTKYYSSDRIAQLIGNGILTFVDIRTKLKKFFSNDEIIFYKSIDDLSKKINFYKSNQKIRIRIAKNGKKKYLKHFNSTKVANFIIDKTMNFKTIKKYFWE